MLRLAARSCLVLGFALAMPPTPAMPEDSPDINPVDDNHVAAIEVVPALLHDPETISLEEGERRNYTLSSGRHQLPSTTSSCRCGRRQTRIVGGTDAGDVEFPWQAGLVPPGDTRTFCGGSVINTRYILTAAHCTESKSPSQVQVMLGDLRIGVFDAGEQRFSVQQIIQHPKYAFPPWSDGCWDFTLLRLSKEITFSNTISSVCLPTAGQTYAGATAIASGYGRLGAYKPQATTLQHVQLPVWTQSDCIRKFPSYISSSVICAGGYAQGGKAICMGDSGGALVTEVSGVFHLIGVPSFVLPCARPGNPDMFARVTEALSWIASNTADVATCRP